METKHSEFRTDNHSFNEEIILLNSYETSEALKHGIREIITSYRNKGYTLINIASNRFVIYLRFQNLMVQV